MLVASGRLCGLLVASVGCSSPLTASVGCSSPMWAGLLAASVGCAAFLAASVGCAALLVASVGCSSPVGRACPWASGPARVPGSGAAGRSTATRRATGVRGPVWHTFFASCAELLTQALLRRRPLPRAPGSQRKECFHKLRRIQKPPLAWKAQACPPRWLAPPRRPSWLAHALGVLRAAPRAPRLLSWQCAAHRARSDPQARGERRRIPQTSKAHGRNAPAALGAQVCLPRWSVARTTLPVLLALRSGVLGSGGGSGGFSGQSSAGPKARTNGRLRKGGSMAQCKGERQATSDERHQW